MYELYKKGALFKGGDAPFYVVKSVCTRLLLEFTQSSHFIRYNYHMGALCRYTVSDCSLNCQSRFTLSITVKDPSSPPPGAVRYDQILISQYR